MEDDLKKKMEDDLNFKQSYWDYLTTKTSKTNGFDTIEIDLVVLHLAPAEIFLSLVKNSAKSTIFKYLFMQ